MSADQKWMNVEELTEYLRCSKSYIYHKVSEKEIPYSKKSGLKFFIPHIDAWMQERSDYFYPDNYPDD
jgi:excisionase family DNA binding protein